MWYEETCLQVDQISWWDSTSQLLTQTWCLEWAWNRRTAPRVWRRIMQDCNISTKVNRSMNKVFTSAWFSKPRSTKVSSKSKWTQSTRYQTMTQSPDKCYSDHKSTVNLSSLDAETSRVKLAPNCTTSIGSHSKRGNRRKTWKSSDLMTRGD